MTADFLQTSPLLPALERACVSHAWGRWGSFRTVRFFYSAQQEYFAIRTRAGMHDISPMAKYTVSGPDTRAFLDRLTPRAMKSLPRMRAAYIFCCDGAGKVLDDATVFCLDEQTAQINSTEPCLDWLCRSAEGFDVKVTDISRTLAAISIQGPAARDVLARAGLGDTVAELPFYGLARIEAAGDDVLVSRSGFTGDLGYELWMPWDRGLEWWERLLECGEPSGVMPIGSAALDLCRVEAGFIMAGSEYINAGKAVDRRELRSPFELGLGWAVDLAKPHFTGRRALVAEQAAGGPRLRLVGLEVYDKRRATDAFVWGPKRQQVGQITAAIWSPILKKSVALALVKKEWATVGTRVTVKVDVQRELRIEERDVPATVVDHHFYKTPRQRARFSC